MARSQFVSLMVMNRLPEVVVFVFQTNYLNLSVHLILEILQVNKFNEWPVFLRHPNHSDAVPAYQDAVIVRTGDGATVKEGVEQINFSGIPEQFPDKIVNNPEEEAKWTARGYARPGKLDADALQKHLAGMTTDFVVSHYPKYIASHDRIVKDAIEEAKLLGLPIPKTAEELREDELREARELREEIAALRKAAATNAFDTKKSVRHAAQEA
jgi:hypothetical protein